MMFKTFDTFYSPLHFQDLVPHYQALKARIPYECPFFKDRDKYIVNEEHKEKESSSRWTCGYCGKSFIAEVYLDKHFTNRHSDTIYKVCNFLTVIVSI